MRRLKWNPTALDDLQQIAEYLRTQNPATEQEIMGRLIAKADQLVLMPRSGQRRETDPSGAETRSLLLDKNHRLIYSVAVNDAVTVLQVLDLRSDQDFYR